MSVNPIRPLSQTTRLDEAGIKFPNTPMGNLAKSIERGMAGNKIDDALGIFKRVINSRTPDFAERVLESAPIFAAFVMKMAVDQIMQKFDVEKERASRLQRLAQERADRARKVSPTEPL
ncbi:MAG: hypothetical protein PHZ04_01155 [Patescibacteria group bacterium]|nr:hypothetical protein [Patescibacteria group bacterium]MDD5554412.1 hypothetical protein [Patescibacteria group bacterium]